MKFLHNFILNLCNTCLILQFCNKIESGTQLKVNEKILNYREKLSNYISNISMKLNHSLKFWNIPLAVNLNIGIQPIK